MRVSMKKIQDKMRILSKYVEYDYYKSFTCFPSEGQVFKVHSLHRKFRSIGKNS